VRSRFRALLPRLHVLPALSGELDQWAEWLVRTRFAGLSDEEIAAELGILRGKGQRVLEGAALSHGDVIADVGAGTGLLTLGAVEQVGPDGDVIAVDISVDALELLRANATTSNISYLIGQADVLPLMDASVDAVVTRSVLIYVEDKAETALEFHRVLRAGGRVSLFEPINKRNLRMWEALDLSPLGDLADRVRAWTEASYANREDPMLNFDEADLERYFVEAGFADVVLERGADEQELPGQRLLNQVGAPGRRTALERWREAFAPDEVDRLAAFVGERVIPTRFPHVFLTARKP
jgi:arsenite methyltransferase